MSQKKKGIQIICVGDYNQLRPVGYEGVDMENSQILRDLCDNNRYVLTTIRRSDNMGEIYEQILSGEFDSSEFEISIDEAMDVIDSDIRVHIVFDNYLRKKINVALMKKHKPQDAPKLECSINQLNFIGDSDDDDDEDDPRDPFKHNNYSPTSHVYLYEGLPVISYKSFCTVRDSDSGDEYFQLNKKNIAKTMTKYRVSKNQNGQVIQVLEDSVILDFAGHHIQIFNDEFFRFLDCAYAMTCHRLQGETIREPFAIHQFQNQTTNWQYTAMSRTSDKSFVKIVKVE
jgi:ATP-dependent exoDNAse (exonuclease V) alpha subunit